MTYLEQARGLLPVLRLRLIFTIDKSPRACSKYSHLLITFIDLRRGKS